LSLGLCERAVVDEGVHLIDDHAELVAGRAHLARIKFGCDLVELID